MGLGPLGPSALSSSSSELHCSCWPHRFHCPTDGCPRENMHGNHHPVPPGASRCYYLETATGFPILQLPTLSRTDGTCKIKQEAANLALTEIRNVLSLRVSPWAGSAGTGALQGRHQRLQSNSELQIRGLVTRRALVSVSGAAGSALAP